MITFKFNFIRLNRRFKAFMAFIEQNVLKIEYLKVEFSEIIGREVTKPINYQ